MKVMATSSFLFGGYKMKKQMSDTIRVGLLLAIVGGFLDAYTYLCRGQVFANAQTGNMVLFGIKMMEGHIIQALYYALPILAFFIGIVIAEMIKHHFFEHPKIHWRQIVLMIEAIVILIVAFLPKDFNMFCNIMISFICSLQVESFRKFNGNPYASTMCTGNLRSGTELLAVGTLENNGEQRKYGLWYYWIDLVFVAGAAASALLCQVLAERAVWVCAAALLSAILFIRYHRRMAEV